MGTLRYWLDLVATLCGFDASENLSAVEVALVLAALAVLVYAAYRAITCTFWPGEVDEAHIKYRVLADEEHFDAR